MTVIDLTKRLKRGKVKKGDGVQLMVDHLKGKIGPPQGDERLQRVRASLERVNNLMVELKKLAEREADESKDS